MTLCLITRTQPGAQVTEANLRAVGYDALAIPAAVIVPTHAAIDTTGVQALLMTSAAAARSITMEPSLSALPVYAVGDATAEAATQAGFTNVISAGGDGATLAVLAADRMKTDGGALLHLRGQEVAGDVTGMLSACGFETRLVEVYHTQDHREFRSRIIENIQTGSGLVLFHSPAGARRFCAAIDDVAQNLDHWSAVGLSTACLQPIQNIGFAHFIAAVQPDEIALMEAIFSHTAQSRP
jgi:uroporphyrinogen-III synthase